MWIVASASLLLASCQSAEADGEAKDVAQETIQPSKIELTGTRVEVAVVQPSGGVLSLDVPGEIEGVRDAQLSAPLGGYIESVNVAEGDRVKAGAVLARVDSRTHGARLVRAQVEKNAAERELERAKSLGTAIPKAELDAHEDRLATAKAALGELQVNAQRSVVTSPFAGVVVKVDAEVGEVAGPGMPLFRLVQLDPVHVTVALSDRDMALAQEGMPAQVSLGARSGTYAGKVIRLSQAANLKTRAFEATIEVQNPDEKLLPGMIAQVALRAGLAGEAGSEKDQKLLVSQDWLVTRPDSIGVFVEKNGKAEWHPVQLGPVLRKQVVVEKGLEPGDALIIVGHRSIAEGDSVLVHRRGKCCENGRAVFGD